MCSRKYRVAYVVSDLKRVGPTNQTLNIIKYSGVQKDCIVITLFQETEDSLKDEYINANIRVECLNLNRKDFLFKRNKYVKKEITRIQG